MKALRIVISVKKRSIDEPEVPPLEITSVMETMPEVVMAQMPSQIALIRAIQREQAKAFPTNLQTIDELGDIPGKYRATTAKEDFLLYNSNDFIDNDNLDGRVIVYATEKNVKMLSKSKI